MNGMYEPRSKYWYEDDEGSLSPHLQWHENLLMLLLALPLMVLFAAVQIFAFLFVILHDFYTTAKRISETGETEFPGMLVAGIVIAIILPILISTGRFDVAAHPIITVCSSIFVLIFTLAPLTGLAWRFLKSRK